MTSILGDSLREGVSLLGHLFFHKISNGLNIIYSLKFSLGTFCDFKSRELFQSFVVEEPLFFGGAIAFLLKMYVYTVEQVEN